MMEELANFLLEKESITGKEFMNIFHKYIPEEEDKGQTADMAEDTVPEADKDTVTQADKDTGTNVPPESGEPQVTEDKPVSSETNEPSATAPNFTLIDSPSDDKGQ